VTEAGKDLPAEPALELLSRRPPMVNVCRLPGLDVVGEESLRPLRVDELTAGEVTADTVDERLRLAE
jgi:hypothetical protein